MGKETTFISLYIKKNFNRFKQYLKNQAGENGEDDE